MTNFAVAKDEYDWIVVSTETKAKSFAMIPVGHSWAFETEAEAKRQASLLSGQEIPTRMIETPNRFEAIADTTYGAAW
jgi:hypothetical protein